MSEGLVIHPINHDCETCAFNFKTYQSTNESLNALYAENEALRALLRERISMYNKEQSIPDFESQYADWLARAKAVLERDKP